MCDYRDYQDFVCDRRFYFYNTRKCLFVVHSWLLYDKKRLNIAQDFIFSIVLLKSSKNLGNHGRRVKRREYVQEISSRGYMCPHLNCGAVQFCTQLSPYLEKIPWRFLGHKSAPCKQIRMLRSGHCFPLLRHIFLEVAEVKSQRNVQNKLRNQTIICTERRVEFICSCISLCSG